MRRRLTAAAALTTALVLGSVAPAFAQEEPGDPVFVDGNPTCADLGLEPLFPRVDPPVDVDNEYVTTELYEDGTLLDVFPKEGVIITAVIVKGGPDAFVWYEEREGLFAPPVGADNENIPAISHYDICGEKTTPTTPTTPPTTPTDTPTGTPTATPTSTESPAKSPKPVPTSVPAGTDDGNGVAGVLGLVLVTGAAAAGAAAVGRRYFARDL